MSCPPKSQICRVVGGFPGSSTGPAGSHASSSNRSRTVHFSASARSASCRPRHCRSAAAGHPEGPCFLAPGRRSAPAARGGDFLAGLRQKLPRDARYVSFEQPKFLREGFLPDPGRQRFQVTAGAVEPLQGGEPGRAPDRTPACWSRSSSCRAARGDEKEKRRGGGEGQRKGRREGGSPASGPRSDTCVPA